MKRTILSHAFLLLVIAVLGITVLYQRAQRQKAAENLAKYHLALSVGLYETLETKGPDAIKGRLGTLVSSCLLHYEERYGSHAPEPEMAQKIVQAKAIRQDHQRRLHSINSGPGAAPNELSPNR